MKKVLVIIGAAVITVGGLVAYLFGFKKIQDEMF